MIKIVLFLFGLSSALQAFDCYKIICNQDENNDTCMQVFEVQKSITVSPCASGKYCPSASIQFSTITLGWKNENCVIETVTTQECPTTVGKTNVGNYCCENTDCFTNICTNNKCIGKELNSICSSNLECKPNEYCKGITFTDIEQVGNCALSLEAGTPCNSDANCMIGHGCNQGTCTQLFSLEAGLVSENKKFCKSDFRVGDHCEQLEVYVGNEKLKSPYECYIGSICSYYLAHAGEKYSTNPCQCTGNDSDVGYCGEFIESTGFLNEVYTRLQYSESLCTGIFARTDQMSMLYNCGSIDADAYNYYNNMLGQAQHWTVYQSGVLDGCASRLSLFDPSYNVNSYGDDASMLIFAFIYIIL